MAFIREHQLSIMLFMSGICGILAFTTLFTESLSRRKKGILALMELSAMMLLLSDRLSYLYRGVPGGRGFFIVHVGNGLVFLLSIFIPHLVTQYLKDLLRHEGGLESAPRLLKLCDGLFAAGALLLIASQFTGLYYTFDAQNRYQRSPGFALSYVVPILIVLLQEATILKYRERLSRGFILSLTLSIALPTVMSIVQVFCYGLSLTSMMMVFMVIVFYIYALNDLNRAFERARTQELEFYKEAEKKEAAMFEQTAQALANAIDAKDKYTHGHSTRVAAISKQIAEEAGFSQKECSRIYFAALLHDVGKIGIRDEVINKTGRLTDEEFEHIKLHPVLGYQILSSIRQSPSLSIGALYHHERYDGSGYPEGLRGEEIPEVARIIAVADAFDAMSSTRSYRSQLPDRKVRDELVKGMGKQFDPKYAGILLRIIKEGRLPPASSADIPDSGTPPASI